MLRGWTARFLPLVLHELCSPTSVLGVHGIATYARFFILKKPDFNSVLGFHGPTSRFGLGLKTMIKMSLGLGSFGFVFFFYYYLNAL